MKKFLIIFTFLFFTNIANASPVNVNRITDHIEPLIVTDYIKGIFFNASSTTSTSTLPRVSSTGISTSWFCLSGDCKSSWPGLSGFTTDDLSEGVTNLYFTAPRAISAVLTASTLNAIPYHAPTGLEDSIIRYETGVINIGYTPGFTGGSLLNVNGSIDIPSGYSYKYNGAALTVADLGLTNSDGLTEGSTNLYVTPTDRTNLGNLSGVNTGDQDYTQLGVTGTPSSSTYLRGDGTWNTPPGGVSGGSSGMLTSWTNSTTLTATGTPTAAAYTATSTTASQLPYASSTAITLGGLTLTGSSVSNSFFVGEGAGGSGGASATYSNFIGFSAGSDASAATQSNFFGLGAGQHATNAGNANFIGSGAGQYMTNGASSNVMGYFAGYVATNASYSNFFGYDAGGLATNASSSIFMGQSSGYQASNASHSIFLGKKAGYLDSVNNSSSGTSILIGEFTGTGGFSDSIAIGHGAQNSAARQLNLGNVLFATNIYNSDTTSPTPVSSGNVGISTTTPYAKLSVVGTDTASTTLAIRPVASQTANIVDIYSTTGVLSSVIDSAGNFGIGTTSPSAKLSVAGDILGNKITGSYFIATSTTATSTLAGALVVGTATSAHATSTIVIGTTNTGVESPGCITFVTYNGSSYATSSMYMVGSSIIGEANACK